MNKKKEGVWGTYNTQDRGKKVKGNVGGRTSEVGALLQHLKKQGGYRLKSMAGNLKGKRQWGQGNSLGVKNSQESDVGSKSCRFLGGASESGKKGRN